MVTFICYHCNATIKKPQVLKHTQKCRRPLNLICIDCKKNFHGADHEAHTSCLSEKQLYWGQYANKKPHEVDKVQKTDSAVNGTINGSHKNGNKNGQVEEKSEEIGVKFPGWRKAISNAMKKQTKQRVKLEKIRDIVVKEYLEAHPDQTEDQGIELFDQKVAEGKTYKIQTVQYLEKI